MIESIMAKGFIAISAYMYMFALVALILFHRGYRSECLFEGQLDSTSRKSASSS